MDSGPASWRRGLPNTAGSLRTGQLTAPFLRSAVRGRARPGVQARACAHSSAASLSRVPVLWPLAGPCRAGTKRLRVPPEQERPRFARLRVTWARGEGERRGGQGRARASMLSGGSGPARRQRDHQGQCRHVQGGRALVKARHGKRRSQKWKGH